MCCMSDIRTGSIQRSITEQRKPALRQARVSAPPCSSPARLKAGSRNWPWHGRTKSYNVVNCWHSLAHVQPKHTLQGLLGLLPQRLYAAVDGQQHLARIIHLACAWAHGA